MDTKIEKLKINKRMNGITVVHDGDIMVYPPILSLLENLLEKNISVFLICSTPKGKIPEFFFRYNNFYYHYIPPKKKGVSGKLDALGRYRKNYRAEVDSCMKKSNFLWTTTDGTAKLLGKQVLQYSHIMQLMELIEYMPISSKIKFIKAPLDRYARAAYKVVVPQIDRSYIQKAWWNLPKTPSILPNKPYRINQTALTPDLADALSIIKNEKKKIILYMGVVAADRTIEPFADAIQDSEEYSLYIIGRPGANAEPLLKRMLERCNNVKYLGFFEPPKHLEFLKYVHLGIMPYKVEQSRHYSKLNALYCAPNKIFEYSAFGIPMIGTDVLGLKLPFEQYRIGICCKDLDKASILDAIVSIEKDYEEYRTNCKAYYRSVDLDQILEDILYG